MHNIGSENSREFCQHSETTPGESVYSSDEEARARYAVVTAQTLVQLKDNGYRKVLEGFF